MNVTELSAPMRTQALIVVAAAAASSPAACATRPHTKNPAPAAKPAPRIARRVRGAGLRSAAAPFRPRLLCRIIPPRVAGIARPRRHAMLPQPPDELRG